MPTDYTILLSAHSAGGAAVASALTARKTGHLGGLILFDALWGQPDKDDPKKIVSGQRDALLSWIRQGCEGLAVVLKDRDKSKDDKDAAIAALPGVRGYWEGGYSNTYSDLQARIDATVARAIRGPPRRRGCRGRSPTSACAGRCGSGRRCRHTR